MVKKVIDLKGVEAAKEFVNMVRHCDYSIDVLSQQYVIDGKSILGLLSLDLSQPVEVYIRSDECDELLKNLEKFAHEEPEEAE